jgi:hypothetical protein
MWLVQQFPFGLQHVLSRDPKLQVRTFDLASAYRQVALSNGGQLFACIRVFNPEKKRLQFSAAKYFPLVLCGASTHFSD